MSDQRIRAAVVVLGELARSPRMLNHARELHAAGFETILVGYAGRDVDLAPGMRVHALHPLRRAGERSSKLAFLAASAVRMGMLWFELTAALIRERPHVVLVQNPPGFPAILSAWIAARWSGARLLVDWHNYSFSMLALRLGSDHAVVRVMRWHEGWAGRRADASFCVSNAMRSDLAIRWRIEASTLYDRPLVLAAREVDRNSKLTIVCPAGWTGDEDMAMLLDAIALLPPGMAEFHLTGDGPQKAALEQRIAGLRTSSHEIHTGFLPEADYRSLIRRADLGLSLHRSSSNLDLAMKVVDLFAACVPVCALDYGGCLGEQVRDGENGYVFQSARQLADIIQRVAANPDQLKVLRENIRAANSITWADEWNRVVLPVLRR